MVSMWGAKSKVLNAKIQFDKSKVYTKGLYKKAIVDKISESEL